MNPYQEVINCLTECVPACEMCAKACLEEENVKPMVGCIKLTKDCANICSLGVQLLSAESELSEVFIGLCVDICQKCAEECETHDHEHCKKCAEVCHKCKDICREYLDNRRQVAMDV